MNTEQRDAYVSAKYDEGMTWLKIRCYAKDSKYIWFCCCSLTFLLEFKPMRNKNHTPTSQPLLLIAPFSTLFRRWFGFPMQNDRIGVGLYISIYIYIYVCVCV